jgi:undecaprenyl-diphosphatase
MDSRLFRDVNSFADHTGWAHWLVTGYARYGIVLFAVLLLACFFDARSNRDLRMVSGAVP